MFGCISPCFPHQAQYTFIHTAVLEALLVGTVSIPCSNLVSRMKVLEKLHPANNMTGYEEQFKVNLGGTAALSYHS